jgi:hypothetical protein
MHVYRFAVEFVAACRKFSRGNNEHIPWWLVKALGTETDDRQ